MLRTLQGAFQTAFRDKFSFGALICFLVTVADIQIFQIGAAFWGLVFGLAATYLLERDDLKANETPKRP
jgi:benzoate membrane transport protein